MEDGGEKKRLRVRGKEAKGREGENRRVREKKKRKRGEMEKVWPLNRRSTTE